MGEPFFSCASIFLLQLSFHPLLFYSLLILFLNRIRLSAEGQEIRPPIPLEFMSKGIFVFHYAYLI